MKSEKTLHPEPLPNSFPKTFEKANSGCSPFSRLISFHSLPQSHRESFLSRYGAPCMDMLMDEKTPLGTDILRETSEPCCKHGKGIHTLQYHNHEISYQPVGETALYQIKSLTKSEKTQYLLPNLSSMYLDYLATHRKMGSRCQMRSLFVAEVRRLLKRH